jgi:glutamate N-acetyltransferase / amino-acid N-acetyltransferase
VQEQLKIIPGGVVAPQGFRTAGVSCGIKQIAGRNDLALIVSETDAAATGVFTSNVVKAHCVLLNQDHIKDGMARAVVVNAGNANACNGERGRSDARRIVQLAAKALGVPERRVLNASTGVIGHFLPMEKVEAGIESATARLHGGEGSDAAQAIMTTDTFPKEIAVAFEIGGAAARMGAMAKGSGMIAPNMATMLAFITTDAAVAPGVLQETLRRVVDVTFNAVTVDGDTSTNDMCLLLANGAAGNTAIVDAKSAEAGQFEKALHFVCEHLAKEIARDGEGATKLVAVTVKNVNKARQVAKTIANSPLVKTALFGNDPNWGRILAAAGRSGAAFDPDKVTIALAGTPVYAGGSPVAFDPAEVSEKMKAREIQIVADFHQPSGETATVWTCDLSYDYVKINADYHT